MTEEELAEKLNGIRKNLKLFDQTIRHDWDKDHKCYVNERQGAAISELLKLFKSLNWQLALNSYKKLNVDSKEKAIRTSHMKCGQAVKISPCAKEYEGKTYFGILIGDVAQGTHCSIDDEGNLSISMSYYNPAILVPELGKIIYGCESWWGEIDSEEDLKKVITEDTINNVWYVQMMKAVHGESKEPESE